MSFSVENFFSDGGLMLLREIVIILDPDDRNGNTFGAQQLALFNEF